MLQTVAAEGRYSNGTETEGPHLFFSTAHLDRQQSSQVMRLRLCPTQNSNKQEPGKIPNT